MSVHNDLIHWVPDMVGSKRFGNWIKDARDWNISRNRFGAHRFRFGLALNVKIKSA